MKAIIVFLAAFVILAAVTPASAQDWVMDWTSRGSSVGILTGPFSEGWTISGTSPTSLSPGAVGATFGLPPNFSAPAYTFGFTSGGHSYGGPVSEQTNFQSFSWGAPVPCAGIYTTSCLLSGSAFGSFVFTDPNHFNLDVFVGSGHEHTELVGVGHRAGVTASTPEPATMAVGAIALVGAALMRRCHRSRR
jgi:PEP-CTERM motif